MICKICDAFRNIRKESFEEYVKLDFHETTKKYIKYKLESYRRFPQVEDSMSIQFVQKKIVGISKQTKLNKSKTVSEATIWYGDMKARQTLSGFCFSALALLLRQKALLKERNVKREPNEILRSDEIPWNTNRL